MDLSAPIAYNGLTVSGSASIQSSGQPSHGIQYERIDISNADIDSYFERRALQDGMNGSDIYEGARHVTIAAQVYGSTAADGWDLLESFIKAYSPRLAYNADSANLGFLPLTFQQPTTSTANWPLGYIPLQIYARPTRPAAWTVDRDAIGTAHGKGIAFKAAAQLVARDPRRYVQTAQTVLFTTATQTSTHRGDYPVFPIVQWSMTAAGLSNCTFMVANQSVVLDMSAQVSGNYTLDYSKRLLTAAGVNEAALISTATASFQEIQPGGSPFNVTNSTGMTNATLTYNEAFA